MLICEHCFKDEEVLSIIKSKDNYNKCSVCNSENVRVYDTDSDEELTAMFEELLSIYTPSKSLPKCYPKSHTTLLKTELKYKWNIFNDIDEACIQEILVSICKDKYKYNNDLFELSVGIKEKFDNDYLKDHSLLANNSWEDFVKSLKYSNRFHTNHINLSLLERFCSFIVKTYYTNKIFYRCRISSDIEISIDEMGAPPVKFTVDGRANAQGIRCLYIADSIETSIYETRPRIHECVSVGKFKLLKDIKVVDLKKINRISPFIQGMDILEYSINKDHLNKINTEMGKVMRSSDSKLDYIPTQYIADFVKNISSNGEKLYAGIEYQSVLNRDGFNVAIFDPELFKCQDLNLYKIENINYNKSLISN